MIDVGSYLKVVKDDTGIELGAILEVLEKSPCGNLSVRKTDPNSFLTYGITPGWVERESVLPCSKEGVLFSAPANGRILYEVLDEGVGLPIGTVLVEKSRVPCPSGDTVLIRASNQTGESLIFPNDWLDKGFMKVLEAQDKPEEIKPQALSLNSLAQNVFYSNLQSGWWHDPVTGEDLRDNIYARAVKLSLIGCEVAEAIEGIRKGSQDKKLPQYLEEEVELADVLIRLLDYCGMRGFDLDNILKDKMAFNNKRSDHKKENRAEKGGKRF